MRERVYINIPPITMELLQLSRGICSMCDKQMGMKTYARCISPIPDVPNDPWGEIEAREHPLLRADFVILYLGNPYGEVFDDLRVAVEMAKPCVVLVEKGKIIDTPLIGVTGVVEVIEFSSRKDALAQIEIAILKWQWEYVVGRKVLSV